MDRLENFKIQIAIIIFAQVIALIVLNLADIDGISIVSMAVLLIINIMIIIWIVIKYQREKDQRDIDISRILGHDAKDALIYGEIGLITYDEQYTATWVNEFLAGREVLNIGSKLTSWLPQLTELIQGEVDHIIAKHNGYAYEISRKESGQVLFVRDVTEIVDLKERFQQNGVVAGLLQLDNYMEIQQYEDEVKMAQINMSLRQPVVAWADDNGMFVRRLRSDRFLVFMNETIFAKVVKDRFSILNIIRKNAEDIDVNITLSMSFARGTDDYQLLDTMVNDLLELAQSRGGDQAAVKKYGESVKYYGGNSEAREKRSKVRVRVMAQAIKEAIMESDRVFIIGHAVMDFDCMGAALCMSRLAVAYNKECYVVSESGGMDGQLQEALKQYDDLLKARHRFIDDATASKMIEKNDLAIVVDHHNPNQTGAPLTLNRANRIVVIDHHRRSEDFVNNPLLVYVESGASSVCELAAEFLPYQTNKIDICEQEATIMYVGILVDTNRFRMRTGSRTFGAAAYLKNLGVDPIGAENMLKEEFEDFEAKTNVMKFSKKYVGNTIIAAVNNSQVITRTLMSQAADGLLDIKGIEASFVIANVHENKVAISARSKGSVNVQVIMEQMHGGGHFSAAALQRDDGTSVNMLEEELKQTIDNYFKEQKEDESNEINIT